MRAATVLVVYAVLLVLGGLYAYVSAPAGANATTALIVPGIAAALVLICAAMAAMLRRSRLVGMIGIHAGLVMPLLLAAAFANTAWSRTQSARAFPAAAAEYEQAASADATLAEPEARRDFFRARGTTDHDPTYLRNILWGLTGLSVATFLAMIMVRPKPERRGATGQLPDVLKSDAHPIGTPSNPPPLNPPPPRPGPPDSRG